MDDFLSNLAARNLPDVAAKLPVVQPRPRARFEPASMAEGSPGVLETVVSAEEQQAVPDAPPGPPSSRAVVAGPSTPPPERQAELAGGPAGRRRTVVATEPLEQVVERVERAAGAAPAQHPWPDVAAARPVAVDAAEHRASPPEVAAARPAEQGASRTEPAMPEPRGAREPWVARPRTTRLQERDEPAAPGAPTPPAAHDAPLPAEAPPPAIHVTIGRVEVRAAPPPPVPAPRTTARGLTLEEYLRRGGK